MRQFRFASVSTSVHTHRNMASTITFTNELVLQLLESYKSYGLLWDTSNPHYKDRVKKNDAWDDMAHTMNMPRRELESKIHTLRSQFTREKKKVALLRRNGREDAKSSWFAYEPMTFLLKGETPGDLDNSEIQIQHNSNELPESFHTENFYVAAPSHYESTDATTPPPNPSKSHNQSRKRITSYDEKSEDNIGVYNFAKHFRQSSIQDEFDIYAQYVASELRQTKDFHSVLMAKHYINNILFNARMGKYCRGGSSSTSANRTEVSIKSEHDVHISD